MHRMKKLKSRKKNGLYDVPSSIIKMKECDTLEKQVDIETKENVSYDVLSPRMKMTECQAYGSLPNRP